MRELFTATLSKILFSMNAQELEGMEEKGRGGLASERKGFIQNCLDIMETLTGTFSPNLFMLLNLLFRIVPRYGSISNHSQIYGESRCSLQCLAIFISCRKRGESRRKKDIYCRKC
jgi:hypothetical protein